MLRPSAANFRTKASDPAGEVVGKRRADAGRQEKSFPHAFWGGGGEVRAPNVGAVRGTRV